MLFSPYVQSAAHPKCSNRKIGIAVQQKFELGVMGT